jgi:hypothetical protein
LVSGMCFGNSDNKSYFGALIFCWSSMLTSPCKSWCFSRLVMASCRLDADYVVFGFFFSHGHIQKWLNCVMLGVQGMKESARMELSSVAEEHWSDGALDVRIPFALTRIWSNHKT